MTITQASAGMLTVASLGAASDNATVQTYCLAIAGSVLGAFVASAGWKGESEKITVRRFLVHLSTGFAFAIPLTRAVCDWLKLHSGPAEIIAGSFLTGVFGVVLLDLIPAFFRHFASRRGIDLQISPNSKPGQQSTDQKNEPEK